MPGRVSVVMQLSDSVTHQLLARVVDTQQGDEYGNLSWTSSVSSSDEARRIIDIWAYALRLALDKVNEVTIPACRQAPGAVSCCCRQGLAGGTSATPLSPELAAAACLRPPLEASKGRTAVQLPFSR